MKGKEVDPMKANTRNTLLKKLLEDRVFSNRYTKISKMYRVVKELSEVKEME